MPFRFWALSALAVGAAVLVWVVMFSGSRSRARQVCVARGGEVVIQAEPQSIGQFCVMPSAAPHAS